MFAHEVHIHAKTKNTEAFLIVPAFVWRRRDLSDSQKMLLSHIWSFGVNGCWQSNQTLANLFNVTPRQITTRVASLAAAGCLLWIHTANQNRTLWAVEQPDVAAADALPYRSQMVLKTALLSACLPGRNLLSGSQSRAGDHGPDLNRTDGRELPAGMEETFQPATKKTSSPDGRNLPPIRTRTNTGTKIKDKDTRQRQSKQVSTARDTQVSDSGGVGGITAKQAENRDQSKARATETGRGTGTGRGTATARATEPAKSAQPANLPKSAHRAAAESDRGTCTVRGTRRPGPASVSFRLRQAQAEAELAAIEARLKKPIAKAHREPLAGPAVREPSAAGHPARVATPAKKGRQK